MSWEEHLADVAAAGLDPLSGPQPARLDDAPERDAAEVADAVLQNAGLPRRGYVQIPAGYHGLGGDERMAAARGNGRRVAAPVGPVGMALARFVVTADVTAPLGSFTPDVQTGAAIFTPRPASSP